MSTADSAAPTTPAAVDGLSEEDLALAASAQASSDDWSAGPPPGKANAFWPSFTRMLALLAPFRIQLVMAGLASVVSVVLTVIAPKVLGRATNIVFEGAISSRLPAGATKEQAVESLIASGHGDMADMVRAMELVPGAGIDYSALGRVLLLALAVYIGSAVLSWLEGFILNRITIKAMLRLRADVEAKIHHLPLSYFDRVQRGELLSRVTNDVDNITNTLQQSLSGALTAILTVLGVLAMMLSISWKLTLAMLIILPLMAVIFGVIGPRSQKAFTVQWAKTGRLNVRVEESFSGHALVRTYGRMRDSRERFDAENEELYRAGLRAQFLSGLMMPIMQVIGNLAYVVIAVLGGFMVAGGSLRLGDVQAFIQYSQQFSQPLGELGGMATAVQSGTASAERVFELLDVEEERPDDVDGAGSAPQAAPRPAHGGVIEMDRVRFSYDPDVELIRDLSLRVEPGQTVAIVGPTGPARLPWSTSSCASTTSMAVASPSTAWTFPPCAGATCGRAPAWCCRTRGSSRARSARTSATGVPAPRTRRWRRPRAPATSTTPCGRCPRATRRSWRRRPPISRPASVSCSPSPGPSSRIPPSSSWTRPPVRLTREPSSWCSGPWGRCGVAARASSSPTVCPPSATRTRSWSWSVATSSSRAAMQSCWSAAAPMRAFMPRSSPALWLRTRVRRTEADSLTR